MLQLSGSGPAETGVLLTVTKRGALVFARKQR